MADNVSINDASNTPVAVFTDQVTDPVSGAVVQKQIIGIVDATADSTNRAVVNAKGELSIASNDAVLSTTLVNVGDAATLALNGDATVSVQISGTHAGTQVFEGTVDGSNWISIGGVVQGSSALVTSVTANGAWNIGVQGLASFRVRRTVATSGTVNIAVRASDSTQVVTMTSSIPAGSNVIGAVTQNGGWSVSSQGTQAVGSTTAHNPTKLGGVVATSNPTAQASTALTNVMVDKVGRTVVVQGHVREMMGSQSTTITTTTATTIVTAGGAGVFNDLTQLDITNSSSTGTVVTLAGGANTRTIYIAGTGGISLQFNPPLVASTANAAWTLTLGTAVSSVYVNAAFIKNI